MVLLSHPTGNANVAAVADALEQEDLLAAYFTCIHWNPDAAWARMVPSGLRSTLERRARVQIPRGKIHTRPARELVRNLLLRTGKTRLTKGAEQPFSIDAVYRDLDRHVARRLGDFPGAPAVYAYEDGALEQFRAAEQRGLKRVYDLPIGYWRAYHRLMAEERELQPAWAATLGGITDGAEKLALKDAELQFASSVLVASSFTKNTLAEYPGGLSKPIFMTPYGAPQIGPERTPTKRGDPLRVLYVGSIGQRKGVAYLLEAIQKLSVPYVLTMLGRPVARPSVLDAALAKHRWIASAPHGEVLRLMREHDVLVFPSLFEGFGLVILEAMAQGCVVIATPHTAAPDIFDDGCDGVIVPIRDSDAIAAALTRMAEDRDWLHAMSVAAQQKAATRTWESYRLSVVQAVAKTLALDLL